MKIISKLISKIPLTDIAEIELYIGKCRKTISQVAVAARKKRPECDVYIINGGMWNPDGSPCRGLKVDGNLLSLTPWGDIYGYGWNTPQDMAMTTAWQNYRNYLSCTCLIGPGKQSYDKAQGGRRGRSAIGMTGDKLVLYCSSDGSGDAQTPEQLRDELAAMGCKSAVMLDSGGSSQCDFNGQRITSSRKVHNLIVVYVKKKAVTPSGKEDKPTNKTYKVCLDPGHGVETPGKRSPDGTYMEHEFALDMARRMKTILERHGVSVTLTRSNEHCPTGKSDNNDLARRVQIANSISGLDLFVSLHSNAAGSGSQWMSARGYEVYTSAAGATAGRNIAAKKVLARAKEAGVTVRSMEPRHESWYVCVHTNAPAMLIEHLFHDNKNDVALLKDSAYRDKLAEANCKGILDYLGIDWKAAPAKEPEKPPAKPWYADAQAWAVSSGISDGTRPEDTCTRAEVWEMLRRTMR